MGQDVKIGIGVALCIGLLRFILVVARSGCGPEEPVGDQTAQAPADTAETTQGDWKDLKELELVEPRPSAAAEREAEAEIAGLPPEEPSAPTTWPGEEVFPSTTEEAVTGETERSVVPPAEPSPIPGSSPLPVVSSPVPPLQTHTIEKGDSLWDLAARYYGDGHRWKRIHEANREVLPSPNDLPVGAVLVIPPADTHASDTSAPESVTQAPPAPGTPGTATVTYTVKSRDTLYSIAVKQYGDGSLWRTIYEANQDKISSPDRLAIGTVLVIPLAP